MEVLISTFVLSIGMLGLAALIPVGRYAIVESGKADRSAACGRAAMRDIKVRRMLDYRYLVRPSSGTAMFTASHAGAVPFVIDPYGSTVGLSRGLTNIDKFAGTEMLRANLAYPNTAGSPPVKPYTADMAEKLFMWRDDLEFSLPADASKRPVAHMYGNEVDNTGHYTWLATVAPAMTELAAPYPQKKTFQVSVAVCFQRDFNADAGNPPLGEDSTGATFLSGGLGGGAVQLDKAVYVRANQWVLMVKFTPTNQAQCHWYRVVSAGNTVDGNPGADMLMLAGPDWQGDTGTCIVVQSVIGVYATTIEQASGIYDPLWLRF